MSKYRMRMVEKILTGKKFCSIITGGGSGSISSILQCGGGSKVLLEHLVPYSKESINSLIKYTPKHYVTQDLAQLYSQIAYNRAVELSGSTDVIGIGSTAKLFYNGQRQDRVNSIYVSKTEFNNVSNYHYTLYDYYGRYYQESFCEDLILLVLSDTITPDTIVPVPDDIASVYNNQGDYAFIPANGPNPTVIRSPFIFPGSFNPIHDGHVDIARAVYNNFGNHKIYLEISVNNTDKIKPTYADLLKRIDHILKYSNESWLGGIIITNQSLFVNKLDIYLNGSARFIVGSDTLNRILNMMDMNQAIKLNNNASFYVAIRQHSDYPSRLIDLFGLTVRNIPYTDHGISSTKIREELCR